jgi:hypothetical protein
LTAFAVRLRYDNVSMTPVDRSQALAWACAATRWARELIEQD